MKQIIALGLLFATLMACDETGSVEDLSLLGSWQLAEVLADPGDGSGTYQPVNSQKTLTFHTDGTFRSTENMCPGMGNDSRTGRLNLADSTLLIDNCTWWNSEENASLHIEFDGINLYVLFPCIEPCGEKYRKIETITE